jgi:hypothetical protein
MERNYQRYDTGYSLYCSSYICIYVCEQNNIEMEIAHTWENLSRKIDTVLFAEYHSPLETSNTWQYAV